MQLLDPLNCKQISKFFSPYLTAAGDGISATVNIDWYSTAMDTGTMAGIVRLYYGRSADPANLLYTSELMTEMPNEVWLEYFWQYEQTPVDNGWYLVTFTPVYILSDSSVNELGEYAVSEEIYYADGPVNTPTQYELYYNQSDNNFYALAAWVPDEYGTIGVMWYAYNELTYEYYEGWHEYADFGTAIDLSELPDGYYSVNFSLEYRTVTGIVGYVNIENAYSYYSYVKGEMYTQPVY